jgi:glyoxylase-like metal-dependent hydrolase (beta-lactamase superfamily II)
VITVSGLVQKQAWEEHLLPPVELVRPDLWSVPVPIPNNPLRYVNCYVFGTPQGAVLVDPGWPLDGGWEALTAGLAEIGTDVSSVHGVLVTHAHRDHHGLATRLRQVSGCWVAMHPAEAEHLGSLRDIDAVLAANDAWMELCGVPSDDRDDLLTSPHLVRDLNYMTPDRLLHDREDVRVPGRTVTALWTPGHTPGHLCYVVEEDDVLLTGDHLLPRITSNISSYETDESSEETRESPLHDYLVSLELLRPFEEREALPGHEYRFRGIGARVEDLQSHHRRRLAEIVAQLQAEPGRTAWESARALAWSRSWEETTGFMRRTAIAETLAHLRLLERDGVVRSDRTTPAHWFLAPR